MRRIYTISSKNPMNTHFHVLQMTRNLLDVKKQKKLSKRKFFLGSKTLKPTSTAKDFPETYMIVTPVC